MSIRNLQNFPREARIKRLVVPLRENEVILEADLSQAEAMIVAWKARETRLIEKYERREDVHSFVGSLILGKTITKANKPERHVAKIIGHGSNYDMQAERACESVLDEIGVVVPLAEMKRRKNLYHQNFPNIKSVYQKGIQDELGKRRTVTTPDGWTRKFYTPWGPELFREAYAHFPQNCVALVLNTALQRMFAGGYASMILGPIHDSLLMSVPEVKLEEVKQAVVEAMTYKFTFFGRDLVIPTELKVGKNWGELCETNL